MSANSGAANASSAANAADPVVRLRESPVAAPPRPSASAGANTSSSLFSWVTHPTEAFGALRGMLSKKPQVEINEDFLESMQGVTELQNPSIEKLLEKYSDNPDMLKILNERKFAGIRARYQLINLISSMLQYLNEYRKARTTPLLQISATEDLLDDLLLYLVYLYEKDAVTKNVQDKIRSLGGRAMELRDTMSQNMSSSFIESIFGRPQARYQIPAKFNEALNTFLDLNIERAKIWGLVKGSGVREGSGFPFLAGTDNDELDLGELNVIMEEYLEMARAIEKRKVRLLGDTNYKTGSPTANAQKLASLQRTLEHLSTRPDLEAVLHFGPSHTMGRGPNVPAAANVPANVPANAPANVPANAPANVPAAFNATKFSFGGTVTPGAGGPVTSAPVPGKRPVNNNASLLLSLAGPSKKNKTERKTRKSKARKLKSRKLKSRKSKARKGRKN